MKWGEVSEKDTPHGSFWTRGAAVDVNSGLEPSDKVLVRLASGTSVDDKILDQGTEHWSDDRLCVGNFHQLSPGVLLVGNVQRLTHEGEDLRVLEVAGSVRTKRHRLLDEPFHHPEILMLRRSQQRRARIQLFTKSLRDLGEQIE